MVHYQKNIQGKVPLEQNSHFIQVLPRNMISHKYDFAMNIKVALVV